LYLCKRVVEKAPDYGHGIPQKEVMVCTNQIVGFVEVQTMSQVSIDAGKGAIVRASDLLVNILPRNGFDDSKLTKDSRLLYQGVYYQMALIDQPSNIHRGHVLFYQYRLSNAHKLAMEGPQLKPQIIPAAVFFGEPPQATK
jgi:hypothetical protein